MYLAYRFLWPLVPPDMPFSVRKWVLLGIGLGCLMPQIFYEIFFPHPFSITAQKDSVDYEFRDPVMAAEFSLLNGEMETEDDDIEVDHALESAY